VDRAAMMEELLDHYEHPRHYGPLAHPSLRATGSNPGCGDVVTIYAALDPEGRLREVNFEGQGCTISQAAASMLTEMVQGKSLAEIEALGADDLADRLGPEVLAVRPRCATLALDVLKRAVAGNPGPR
jgi:nitrogen fixation NifU-like protein